MEAKLGALHTRDRSGRTWINGKDFADWVDRQLGEADVNVISGGTAFCLRCQAAVEIQEASYATLGTVTVVTGWSRIHGVRVRYEALLRLPKIVPLVARG